MVYYFETLQVPVPNRNNSFRLNYMADSTSSVLSMTTLLVLSPKQGHTRKQAADLCQSIHLCFRCIGLSMKSRDPSPKTDQRNPAASIMYRSQKTLAWIRRFVPPGLRLLLGLFLIGGGILGFLPILGFWMIPLGIAVSALDIRPLWRAFLKKHRRQR